MVFIATLPMGVEVIQKMMSKSVVRIIFTIIVDLVMSVLDFLALYSSGIIRYSLIHHPDSGILALREI